VDLWGLNDLKQDSERLGVSRAIRWI